LHKRFNAARDFTNISVRSLVNWNVHVTKCKFFKPIYPSQKFMILKIHVYNELLVSNTKSWMVFIIQVKIYLSHLGPFIWNKHFPNQIIRSFPRLWCIDLGDILFIERTHMWIHMLKALKHSIPSQCRWLYWDQFTRYCLRCF